MVVVDPIRHGLGGVALAMLLATACSVGSSGGVARTDADALPPVDAGGVPAADADSIPPVDAGPPPSSEAAPGDAAVSSVYGAAGPFRVQVCSVAPSSSACEALPDAAAVPSSSLYVIYYPSQRASGAAGHPILTWGNGTGAEPWQYSVLLSHLASWGLVVVASTNPNTGTGVEMLAAEDYLVGANDDPTSAFFGTLDTAHVGAVGHSQGADGAAHALLGASAAGSTHAPIATLVTIELPAQEWTCFGDPDASCTAEESFDSTSLVRGSVFFVDGSKDTLISPPTQGAAAMGEQSIAAYYAATPATTPRARATLLGADHNDIQDTCTVGLGCAGVGPNGYLGYVTSWLLYQLAGDARARTAFAGAAPAIDLDPAWTSAAQAALP